MFLLLPWTRQALSAFSTRPSSQWAPALGTHAQRSRRAQHPHANPGCAACAEPAKRRRLRGCALGKAESSGLLGRWPGTPLPRSPVCLSTPRPSERGRGAVQAAGRPCIQQPRAGGPRRGPGTGAGARAARAQMAGQPGAGTFSQAFKKSTFFPA